MPRKLLRVIDQTSFDKSKVTYRNMTREREDPSPIILTLEEYEAIRLYHFKKLSQAECAGVINVSQPTFSRILKGALEKLAQALVEDKDFEIIGGDVTYEEWVGRSCWQCGHEWQDALEREVGHEAEEGDGLGEEGEEQGGEGPVGEEETESECPACHSREVFSLKKMVAHFHS